MKTATVNKVIENFNSLPIEDKEFAIDIMNKAYAEANRDLIAMNAQKAQQNLKKNKVKKGNLQDLFNDLENG